MLADIFSIGFLADLLHRRRFKFRINRVIAAIVKFSRGTHQERLPLGPLRRWDYRLTFGRVGWVNDAKLPALHLGNHERVLVLSAGVEFDRPKRSHVEVSVSDGIADSGVVEGLGFVDGP